MESIKRKQFNRYIEQFDFEHLFNQLGWNYVDRSFPKKVTEQTFQFRHIAEKEGFAILICEPNIEGEIPDAQTRKRIHSEISKLHHEHLIIFIDKDQTTQQWQLLVREPNKPVRIVSHKWIIGQAPELLYQKLSGSFFSIEEDEAGTLTIIDVVKRINENFGTNSEKVTKKFYTEFKKQHTQFLDFIQGIDDVLSDKENTNKQWYASLMLNRLMFCYFIQKKGFLNQDKYYLQNKLKACQKLSGSDRFYSFYRSFLLELFHDGLGKPAEQRNEGLPVELGRIPYLNGGLFDVHELERQFDTIHIDDAAFEHIFEFFDNWEWHLDTREHTEGKTINPDVIGYIFEKYINDRAAMGAYYTKEDITDYIGKNTIIPFLFDETERHYKEAFKPESELWCNLMNSGDTYIYDAVKYGVPTKGELFDDLPEEVRVGFLPELERQVVKEDTSPHLWEVRKPWNKRAPQDIGLPTEIYRELIERRKRYVEVKTKIERGEITHINDFITYNLNIRQFAQDFIERSEDPAFIRYFYKALNKVTILDPTCGSGAFLFAAMNILEPLYKACLQRMEEFTEEQPGKHKFFEETLEHVNSDEHPSLQYFIYKSIILNNLYGVDIMKEAVEIAKLRLFLKLVAVVDVEPAKNNFGLEPLPDIDFNIRAGNTLVGFATEKELLDTIQKRDALFARATLDEFKEEFELVAKAFSHFQNSQLINDQGSNSFREAKAELNLRLNKLNLKLNTYLATNYGIDAEEKPDIFEKWLQRHQPFHWFSEFYRIVSGDGGFDVIIGNPPYVEYSKVKKSYQLLERVFETLECGNIYANVFERSMMLNGNIGKLGLIVPISLGSTKRMAALLGKIKKQSSFYWTSFYAERPSKLFDGAEVLLNISILDMKNDQSPVKLNSTGLIKWGSEFRESLFSTISYVSYKDSLRDYLVPRFSSSIEKLISENVFSKSELGLAFSSPNMRKIYYRIGGGRYWKIFTTFQPEFIVEGAQTISSRESYLYFDSDQHLDVAVTSLSSSLFFWYFQITTNGRDLNPFDLRSFPVDFGNRSLQRSVAALSLKYMRDLKNYKVQKQKTSRNTGHIVYEEFYPRKSKPIIDQIDTVLARYYGFSEEELDFIINYDIKYRMGNSLEAYVEGRLHVDLTIEDEEN
jgi:hypothetical protein